MKVNKYFYKINLHKKSFSKKNILHCRYRSGHITESFFNSTTFENVDFIGVNLKKCKFKNALFSNCFFFNCNFSGSDFINAKFSNSYFCSCKFSNCKNICIPKEYIINTCSKHPIGDSLNQIILNEATIKKCEKFRVLTSSNTKINSWVLNLLLKNICSEEELYVFIKHCINSQKKPFITFYDYQHSIENYFHKS